LDVVALLEDLPDWGLVAGQVGTIVEKISHDVFEVEFTDDMERTYDMVPLETQQLIHLHYSPVAA
jgi:hypothetical protein